MLKVFASVASTTTSLFPVSNGTSIENAPSTTGAVYFLLSTNTNVELIAFLPPVIVPDIVVLMAAVSRIPSLSVSIGVVPVGVVVSSVKVMVGKCCCPGICFVQSRISLDSRLV